MCCPQLSHTRYVCEGEGERGRECLTVPFLYRIQASSRPASTGVRTRPGSTVSQAHVTEWTGLCSLYWSARHCIILTPSHTLTHHTHTHTHISDHTLLYNSHMTWNAYYVGLEPLKNYTIQARPNSCHRSMLIKRPSWRCGCLMVT